MPLGWSMVLSKLSTIPGFSATAQHVALFRDLYEQAQKECERLSQECDALRSENDSLRKQMALNADASELVDVEGLLWKRGQGGAFESKPRCPNCADHPVMSRFPPGSKMYWVCSRCNKPFDFAEPPRGG